MTLRGEIGSVPMSASLACEWFRVRHRDEIIGVSGGSIRRVLFTPDAAAYRVRSSVAVESPIHAACLRKNLVIYCVFCE